MNRSMPAALALVLCSSLAFAGDPKASDADAKAKSDALKAAMKGTSSEDKMKAIADCGSVPSLQTADALAPLLVDPSDDIRTAAAGALGAMKGLAEAAKALHGGIQPNEEKSSVLVAIFKGISGVDHASSVPVVDAWVGAKLRKKETATLPAVDAAIECLGGLSWKKCVDALIALLKSTETPVKSGKGAPKTTGDTRIVSALSRLTSQNCTTSADFGAWWKKNEGGYNDDMTPKKK